VAIRWVSSIAGLTSVPIVGATSVDQLNETLKYADLQLSAEQHQRISEAGELHDLNPHAYTYT
jgi:aryl-alcohol dehydrogenase-like predicted oxidoreductase